MERDRRREADMLAAQHADAMRQALRGCQLRMTELAPGPDGTTARLVGYETSDDIVTCLHVVHTGPGADGPRATVETARWTGTRISSPPLRTTLEDHLRADGQRFSAVRWREEAATIEVDGRTVAGRRVHAGDRWWAVRTEPDELEITVVARDWHPVRVAVVTVVDPEPLLADLGRRPPGRPAEPVRPQPVPSELAGEPHRALVDTVLRSAGDRTAWYADGGPVPQLPPYWTALWEAAVHRQMSLADQSRTAAGDAVRGMVAHLSALQQGADWFRSNDRLRERAIAETLLYGTGLGEQVPSRAAQRAWGDRSATHSPGRHAAVETVAAAQVRWIGAWAAWADRHRDS
jgi:hypothetical protein